MMPYTKILLVLTAALANHITSTPPQPEPTSGEMAKDIPTNQRVYNYLTRRMSMFSKV